MILYDVVRERAQLHTGRTAWEYFGKRRTYAEFLSDIDTTADALSACGLGPGDRIAVLLLNSPEMITLIYAASKLGAVLVMLNPKSPSAELVRQLGLTHCRALVFTNLVSAKIRDILLHPEARGILLCVRVPAARDMTLTFRLGCYKKMLCSAFWGDIVNVEEPACCFIPWRRLLSLSSERPAAAATDSEADAIIFFSGGSTGRMRAIVHSSCSLNDSARRCLESEPPMTDREVMLSMLPAFHAFGFVVSIHICFAGGMTCLLVPVFHPQYCSDLFIRRKPTYTAGVPVNFEKMLPYLEGTPSESTDTTAFKHGFCGGDMISSSVRDRFNKFLHRGGGNGYISGGYGLTECCPASLNEKGFFGVKSIGKPFNGIVMEIFEPGTDKPLPIGTEGEICISSSSNLKYAFDFEGVCTDFLQLHLDGLRWLHTGDLGRRDAEGHFYFTCRLRRLIKVSGNTVLAPEVEEVIEAMPFVEKAYVVAAPDAVRGSVVHAYVVLREQYFYGSQDYIREELMCHCRENLIPWAIPVVIEFCRQRDIPLTPFGKIAWSVLESMAADAGL